MNSLSLSILSPAFAAGLLVLLTHVPLGREVIRRGIIFIDLAIAQIAGLGIILASLLGLTTQGWEVQLIAAASALAGALLFGRLERVFGRYQEAIIGVFFVMAATASIMLLAHHPQGSERLTSLLVGQILWVEWEQLLIPTIMTLFILCLYGFYPSLGKTALFYPIFAIAITVSVQLIGVYLVFASLIIPALGVLKYKNRQATVIAYLLGSSGYGLGLILSALLDLPSGAIIVWCMAIITAIMGLLHHFSRSEK